MSRASRHRTRGTRPSSPNQRQDLSAEVIPVELLVLVGIVFGPRELLRLHPLLELRPGSSEEWPDERAFGESRNFGHGSKAGNTCASHELKEHRFQLVVCVMGREQNL